MCCASHTTAVSGAFVFPALLTAILLLLTVVTPAPTAAAATTTCEPGSFGDNCSDVCHCSGGDADCSQTGECGDGGCSAGYTGPRCQQDCPPDKYGPGCRESCYCMNDGSCDSEDGACACSDPWVGEDCTERIASVLMFASLSVHTDTYVRLRCVAAGIPLPTVNILQQGGFKLASICKNTMADTVECEHVLLPSATANYTCEASNAHGSNSAQATLTIVDPPRLVSPPSVTEIPNSPSSLQVAWKAWQYGVDEGGKEDDTITYKLRYRPQGERTWVVLTTPRTNLTVQFLAANTAYEFAVQCIGIETGVGLLSPIANATSPCAPLRKDTSRLREATIDRVTSHDISLSWIAPSESSLGCGIESYVLDYRAGASGPYTNVLIPATHTSYTLEELDPGVTYDIRLSLNTTAGETSDSVRLQTTTSNNAPGTVQNLVTTASNFSVAVTWDPPIVVVDNMTGYVVTYILKNRKNCETVSRGASQMATVSMDRTYVELEGLLPYSDYEISAQVQAASGKGPKVKKRVRTLEAAPDGAPEVIMFRNIGEKNIDVGWEPIECLRSNGILTQYEYSVSDHHGNVKQTGKVPAYDRQIHLKSLTPYTEYDVALRARTVAGAGLYSPPVHFSTLESVPAEPDAVKAVSVTSRTLTVVWQKPSPSLGNIVQYEVHYWKSGSRNTRSADMESHVTGRWKRAIGYGELNVTVTDPASNSSSISLVDLIPYTQYIIQVFAWSNKGRGLPNQIITTTEEDIPEAPAQLWSRLVSEQSFTLVWREPRAPNGIITDYKVSWSALESYDPLLQLYTVSQQTADNRSLSSVVTGLHPATKYTTRVSARTSKGEGQAVSESYWTKIAVPPAPKAPTVYAHQESTKTVTIAIPAIQLSTGPLSAVKIVVQSDERITRGQLCINLTDHHEAMLADLSCYVTGEMDEEAVKRETYFVIGDDRVYGGYRNVPLMNTEMSSVFLHTVSAFQQELKTSRSEAMPLPGTDDPSTGWLVFGYPWWYLLVLIIIVLVVVLLCVLIIVSARRRKERSRPEYAAHWSVSYRAQDGDVDSIPESMFCNARDSDYSNSTKRYSLISAAPQNAKLTQLKGSKRHRRSVSGVSATTTVSSLVYTPRGGAAAAAAAARSDGAPQRSDSEKSSVSYKKPEMITLVRDASTLRMTSDRPPLPAKQGNSGGSCSGSGKNDDVVLRSTGNRASRSSRSSVSSLTSKDMLSRQLSTFRTTTMRGAIRLEDLAQYIQSKRHSNNGSSSNNNSNNSNNTFKAEFAELPHGQISDWAVGTRPENHYKNRYMNAIPYDNNCVTLQSNNNGYINASFIDGYNEPKAFIATQAPKEKTVMDFWQMVWQEKAVAIIMLTNLTENGKAKCSQYWPEDTVQIGELEVSLMAREELPDTTVRTFTIVKRCQRQSASHLVMHYHYHEWPDHGVPDDSGPLVDVIAHIRDDVRVKRMVGPWVVHCSAGIGRTGTFIALDSMLEQARSEYAINIFTFVQRMRKQRISMVQTQAQYEFIHDAVLDWYLSKDAGIPVQLFPARYQELSAPKQPEETSLMDTLKRKQKLSLHETSALYDQYECLCSLNKLFSSEQCRAAVDPQNLFKNRSPDILPPEDRRVILTTQLMRHGHTDYINAVNVDGFGENTGCIVTQMPTPETVEDFWRMVYEQSSPIIVMLNAVPHTNRKSIHSCAVYWPVDNGVATYGRFTVQVVTFEEVGTMIVRKLKLLKDDSPDEEPLRVTQVQLLDEPLSNQQSAVSMATLLARVHMWMKKAEFMKGPVTVHCMNGASSAGIYCVCSYVFDQIAAEETVDILKAVKVARSSRPQFIENFDQYRFCYDVIKEYLESHTVV